MFTCLSRSSRAPVIDKSVRALEWEKGILKPSTRRRFNYLSTFFQKHKFLFPEISHSEVFLRDLI